MICQSIRGVEADHPDQKPQASIRSSRWLPQASSALAAAAGEVQAALASMHAAFAGDSAEVQREWARFMQKVRRVSRRT
jgi:hypothetical protein